MCSIPLVSNKFNTYSVRRISVPYHTTDYWSPLLVIAVFTVNGTLEENWNPPHSVLPSKHPDKNGFGWSKRRETDSITHLLTYSMVQSPSWEANWFAANQEIPRISRNPTVHYRTHKRPPTVSILGQPNPVHIPTSHLLEIHPNIIHPSTPRSPQCSPSLRFPHQDPIHPPLLTHTRHMPSPSHSSRFYHPHNIGWLHFRN